jgi:hypothetical protein
LDILGNLSKLNVKFGTGVEFIFDFVNNLRVPIIPFLQNLSPIDENDVFLYRRGNRDKMAIGSEETFIFYGQLMVLSLIIIGTRIVQFLYESCYSRGAKIGKIYSLISFIGFTMLGLLYFDIQVIIFSELTSIDVLKGNFG